MKFTHPCQHTLHKEISDDDEVYTYLFFRPGHNLPMTYYLHDFSPDLKLFDFNNNGLPFNIL